MTWIVEPFVQVATGGLYNPITDRTMGNVDERFPLLSGLLEKRDPCVMQNGSMKASLIEDGWLVRSDPSLFRRFRLVYATVEGHSTCNQKCNFCPVSVAPRAREVMSMELFRRIVADLSAYQETLKGLFLFSYNEPTTDPFFLERLEYAAEYGIPVAVNTNGTGLTPAVCRRIEEIGALEYLSVNLATIDGHRYRDQRGVDQLELVLRNLDYAKDRQVANRMIIAVLGGGDEIHRTEWEAILQRFGQSRFVVSRELIMDRAGLLEFGARPERPYVDLGGCNNLGSRPVQHLLVAPDGNCLLCCQDYFGNHVLGNIGRQAISEILGGEAAAKLRRWVYGHEEAPEDFICRKCTYAVSQAGNLKDSST